MKPVAPATTRLRVVMPWVESLALTAIPLAIGLGFYPEDPFTIHAPFPWIWLGAVLVALRYGIGYSLVPLIVNVAAFYLAQRQGLVAAGFPKVFFIGGVMLTMLCGQFSTLWNARLRRATQLSDHAEDRLEQLSRAFYVLRVSHDRMEQNLIIRPVTLRGALIDLRRLLAIHGGELNSDIAGRLLSLLSQYCSIECAAIHRLDGRHLEHTPVAVIGTTSPPVSSDELVRRVFEEGATSYHAVSELSSDEQSRYRVVAPLRVSDGRTLGMLLVEKMPFLALNRENLQVLGVLLGYFADQTHAAVTAGAILTAWPDCPPIFAGEVIKLARLRKEFGIESSLVAIAMGSDPRREQVISRIVRLQRGLDYLWRTHIDDREFVITLMPFAGTVAVEGYLARIGTLLENDFGIPLDPPLISTRTAPITDGRYLDALRTVRDEHAPA